MIVDMEYASAECAVPIKKTGWMKNQIHPNLGCVPSNPGKGRQSMILGDPWYAPILSPPTLAGMAVHKNPGILCSVELFACFGLFVTSQFVSINCFQFYFQLCLNWCYVHHIVLVLHSVLSSSSMGMMQENVGRRERGEKQDNDRSGSCALIHQETCSQIWLKAFSRNISSHCMKAWREQ